jgi:hypothetical protein
MWISRRSRYVVLLLIVWSICAHAENAESDPQHRFTIVVPLGWKVTTTTDAMKMTMGDSFIQILHFPGQGSAVKVLQVAMSQASESFAGGQPLQQGETTFGGERAIFANYAAYDDRSVSVYLRFVATDSGWVFYAGSPQSGFTTLRETFLKIEHSFQLTNTSPATPQNSDSPPTASPK